MGYKIDKVVEKGDWWDVVEDLGGGLSFFYNDGWIEEWMMYIYWFLFFM